MSGHSKWATIKRAKEAKDAKKGAVFTKLSNLITIAAKEKGGDLETNFTLRMAVDKAKAANMPKDNIEKSIKRGTGELLGAEILELVYEAIGPANTQFVVKGLTDNKNRSAAEIRHIFTKHGGAFGAVMWNFEQKGVLLIKNEELTQLRQGPDGQGMKNLDQEELELELIDAGVEDVRKEEEGWTVVTAVSCLQELNNFFKDKGIEVESAELAYVAKDEIELSPEDREKADKIMEALEENEDVADYYTNIKFS